MNANVRMIEVDAATAEVLEARAAERGVSVATLVADLAAGEGELAELDRRWAAVQAGEPTVPHEEVVRWLDTWGTPAFRPWAER